VNISDGERNQMKDEILFLESCLGHCAEGDDWCVRITNRIQWLKAKLGKPYKDKADVRIS
jgi:hypothetical protein